MRTSETIISLFLITVGFLFCLFSFRLGMGKINDPGPGLIPFVSGFILIILSLATILFEGKSRKKTESETTTPKGFGVESIRPASVLISLLIYALVLETLGFILSTFLLLTFLFKMSEKRTWKASLLVSIITTISTYILFCYLLDVELPLGLFGS
jgi:putative tricarboxylic transport membrane protein